jgi:hypothetical protein
MIVDIAETRDNLIKNINDLTMNYSQLLHDRTNIETNKNTEILLLNNQNCLQLQEIQTLNENISELNKKCYDYEQIINEYQSKMVDMEKDKKCENKVSIMRVQADELHKKDQYIDQLQQKIKFLQGDKKNISLKFIDKNDENLLEKNHDEFMQTESEPSPYGSLDGQMDGQIDEQIDETEGWSPTTSRTPVPVPDKVVLDVATDVSVETDVVVEDMDTEGDSDCIDIEYKRIKYKGEKYYIVVGEEPQVVYRHMEDGDVGSKVGIRKKKTKGKGYDIDFD